MAKIKVLALLLVLVLFTQLAFAYEAPLSDFGFTEMSLTDASSKDCQIISADISNKDTPDAAFGVVSIKAFFDGPQNDNSYVTVKVNYADPKIFWPENFVCAQDGCWARVFAIDLSSDSTSIELCVATGNETTNAYISKDSYLGLYDTPVITIETTAPKNVILGDQVKLSTVLKNTGSKDVNIFAQFIHPDTRTLTEITSFDIVQGDSSASTTLVAGETKTFNYYIKPTIPSGYNLPYAVVFFDNVFGERQALTSSHPQMVVSSPQQIEVSVIGVDPTVGTEDYMVLKALVKNLWNEQFEGELLMNPSDLILDANKSLIIPALGQKEVVFETKKLSPGAYQFSAVVSGTEHTYISNLISFDVKKPTFPIEIILAIIGLVAAIAVLYWVYVAKTKK